MEKELKTGIEHFDKNKLKEAQPAEKIRWRHVSL